MSIGDLVVTLGMNTNPLKQGAKSAKSTLGGMLSSFGSMATAGAGLAAGFFGVTSAINTAKWGVQLAAEAEQAKVAFGTLLGSGEAAESMLKDLTAFAASTPFEMPELRNGARMLAAFGIAGDQIVPNLKMIGDIAAGTGQPISELAELYGKMKVGGRIAMEDINQMTGRGIPIIGALATQLGVAESEIRGMVSSGKIGFSDIQQAMIGMTEEGGQFAGMMEAQSHTLAGVWSTFSDNSSLILTDFFTWLAERFDFTGLVASATQWMQQTVAVVMWGLDNWKLLWEAATTSAALQMVRLGAEIAHLFTSTIPQLLNWFVSNFADMWKTYFSFQFNLWKNFATNIRDILTALWDWVASGGTKQFEFQFTSLTEGFTNSIKALPQIAEREMGPVEKALQGQLNDLTTAAFSNYGEFTAQTGQAATAAIDIAETTGPGALAKSGKSTGSGGPATALAGSADAYKLINAAAAKQTDAIEKRRDKWAERQAKNSDKAVELLSNIAGSVGTGEAVEEVDFT